MHSPPVLVLVLVLLRGCCCSPGASKRWRGVSNNGTERIPGFRTQQRVTHNSTMNDRNSNNRAKAGGRTSNSVTFSASELSCRELRSTRYITDGFCRSAKPMKELVCSGQCMPSHLMPNSIGRGKWWRGSASDYRCVPAHSRTRRVQLHCPNGNTRTYKIRMVTSCKCKRFRAHHNQSDAKEVPRPPRSKKNSQLSRERSNIDTPLMGNSY